jgi:superfamily II DNA or RNA helicase
VTIRVDAELSFPVAGLAAEVLEGLKAGELSFPNPEYAKRERLNLWLGDTPEEIHALEIYQGRAYFPRACLGDVRDALEAAGLAVQVEWAGPECPEIDRDVSLKIELRDYQREAVEAVTHNFAGGVVVLPPGSGKTILGAGVVSRLETPALVIVHTKDLLEQWIGAFDKALGIKAGRIGGGRKARIEPITVAMIQTLVRWDHTKLRDLGDRFGVVIVDEAHHCPASTFQRVLRAIRSYFRIGLTATPERDDGRTPLLYWTMGQIAYRLGHRPLADKGHLLLPTVRAVRSPCNPIPELSRLSCSICRRRWEVPTEELLPEDAEPGTEIPHSDLPCPHCLERLPMLLERATEPQEVIKLTGELEAAKTSAKVDPDFSWLVAELTIDDDRNRLLASVAAFEALKGRRVLLLSGRIDHCQWLAAHLRNWGYRAEAVDSGTGKVARSARIQALRDGTILILCATSLADEGLDVAALDAVILATPQRAPGRTIQRVGRVMRPSVGKAPIVYDIVDADNGLARAQWWQRRAAYRKALGVTPERLAPWAK